MNLDLEWRELEFRTGKRLVPPHLADMLVGIPTHRLTYEEAVEVANKRSEVDFLNAKQDAVIAAHFREHR